MGDLAISQINQLNQMSIDVYSMRKILLSDTLTDVQKVNFMQHRSGDIKALMEIELSSDEFNLVMHNRPLLIYKPIKNAFTKRGDKIIMARALGIPEGEIDTYLQKIARNYNKIGSLDFLPPNQVKILQTYAYRHGTKKTLMRFFDNELANATNLSKTLQKTMSYNTGGVADYFSRPIHRMDNQMFVNMFGIIAKRIDEAKTNNKISETDAVELSIWALQQLYVLQNNSKLFKKKVASQPVKV